MTTDWARAGAAPSSAKAATAPAVTRNRGMKCRMSETNRDSARQHVDLIARWIVESEHLFAFTGAGISTDSGIPDFRGPEGVWTRRDAGLPAPRWKVRPDEVHPNASHLAL